MKCICCNREFEIQQRHGGQNRLICYDCMPNELSKKEKDKRRRQCLKIASDTLKEGIGCARCGYNTYGAALDWHHIESHQKEENPAKQLQRSWNTYIKEIEKCILLCANCHREFHHKEREEGLSINDFL